MQAQYSLHYSFVDRDMFMRYMGGGIGHLEQFPPANNDDEDTAGHEDGEDVEIDETGRVGGDGDGSGGGGGKGCEDEMDVDEDEGVDDDEDMEEGEDTEDSESDLGESEDEEIGNVY